MPPKAAAPPTAAKSAAPTAAKSAAPTAAKAGAGLNALAKGAAAKSAAPAKGGAAKGGLVAKIGVAVKGGGAAKGGGASKGGAAKAPVDPKVAEEMKRKAEEEEAAKAAAAAAAEEAKKIEEAKRNGQVEVRYNHYKEKFEIKNGKVQMKTLDDQFALSFVFANCRIHMTDEQPDRGVVGKANVQEHGDMQSGEFVGLEVGKTYWVVVEEDNEEAKKSEERQKAFLARKQKDKEEDEASAKKNPGIAIQQGQRMESCSCIEGNPCADAYCCKDWKNRFEVAKKHGWKGFS